MPREMRSPRHCPRDSGGDDGAGEDVGEQEEDPGDREREEGLAARPGERGWVLGVFVGVVEGEELRPQVRDEHPQRNAHGERDDQVAHERSADDDRLVVPDRLEGVRKEVAEGHGPKGHDSGLPRSVGRRRGDGRGAVGGARRRGRLGALPLGNAGRERRRFGGRRPCGNRGIARSVHLGHARPFEVFAYRATNGPAIMGS